MQTVSWKLHTCELLSTRDSNLTGRAEAQEFALEPATWVLQGPHLHGHMGLCPSAGTLAIYALSLD